MSRKQFDAAFNQARQARLKGDAGDTFNYNGKSYHSYTRDELNEMANSDYNEIAGRLGWKERTTKSAPRTVNDAELSDFSDRRDPVTMKNRLLAEEARQSSVSVAPMSEIKTADYSGEMISPHRQKERNNDPQFMAYLQKAVEDNLMYRPEKDRMEKSPELTDDMEAAAAEIAIMLAGGGIGRAALSGLKGLRAGGSQLLPKSIDAYNGLSSRSKLFKNLVERGELVPIKGQPWIGEVIKNIPK